MHLVVLDVSTRTTFTVRDGCWWLRLLPGVNAMTWDGHTVWCKRSLADTQARHPTVLNHEAVHVQQARRLGWRFKWRYLALLVRYGYLRHPMEVEARRHAGDHYVEIVAW